MSLSAMPLSAQTVDHPSPTAPPEQAAPERTTPERTSDIVVTAEIPGGVISDVPPDEVLSEAEIASYGASNLTDLVGQLAVRTRSGGGRGSGPPVVFLNGRRISGFGEIHNLPAEAIARVEIFPPEVALSYGYGAYQRVINIVLKDNFSAIITEVEVGGPTDGGRWTGDGEVSQLRLRGTSRLNLTANYGRQSALTEAERDIVQADGNANAGNLRTLLPAGDNWSIDGTYARPLSTTIAASLNLRYGNSQSQSLIGQQAFDPSLALRAHSRAETFHAGASSDGRLGRWRWSLTGSYDGGVSRAENDRNAAFANGGSGQAIAVGQDRTRTITNTEDADLVLSGSLFNLPAGPVRTTVQGGWKRIDLMTRSERSGVVTLTDLGRTALSGSTNISVPIASRDNEILDFLGDLSLNGRYSLRDVSDFRTLTGWTYGANWSPVARVDIQLTFVGDQTAPTVSQLGAPTLVTPFRTFFDFTRNETVLADSISGGNPLLLAETRRDFRLQANWRPIAETQLLLTASYARVRSRNTTAEFPLLTPETEAAFAGRVVRGGDGRIVSVDQRPVNFAQTRGRQIRYGVNYSRSFGVPAGGGGGGRGFGGAGGGRWSLGAYHTVRFEDEILIRPGVPILNLLDGSAVGSRGGSPRHEVEFDGGWFFKGVGFRANGTWRDGSRVVGGPITSGGAASDLSFSSQMTINLRAFIDINQQTSFVAAHPIFRNSRVRLSIDNLFNDRQSVRDANGVVPLRYQPGYIDPQGRLIEIEFRKQF